MIQYSNALTVVEKFGFFLALAMTEDWTMWPAHSMSTRGLSTVIHETRFRSRRPQKRTSNLK